MKAKYVLKDDISLEARSLIKALLNRDPRERLNEAEVMAHPWMQGIADNSKQSHP